MSLLIKSKRNNEIRNWRKEFEKKEVFENPFFSSLLGEFSFKKTTDSFILLALFLEKEKKYSKLGRANRKLESASLLLFSLHQNHLFSVLEIN
jgi:hypothetical protein